MRKFDVIVSNPPYSVDVRKIKKSNSRNTVNIFPLFQEIGYIIGNETSMVYPASWQKNIDKDLGKFLIDNGLKANFTYDGEKVFNKIRVTISIVHLKKGYNGQIFINDYYTDRKINKWVDNSKQYKLLKIAQRCPTLKMPTYKINLRTRELTSLPFKETKTLNTDVIVWLKEKIGKQPDTKPYYINRSIFKKLYPDYPIEKYRVMIRSRLVGRQTVFREMVFLRNSLRKTGNGLQARMFTPFETSGETWKEIAAFNTKEEAINFRNYLNTMILAEFAYLDYSSESFFSKIPLLTDYTNNNKLFTGLPNEAYKVTDKKKQWEYLKHLEKLENKLKEFFEL